MISDVLSEAVCEIDCYLNAETWRGFYGSEDDPLVREIRALRDAMDAMRARLDTVPTAHDALRQA